jgi:hypothetical protein
MREDNTTVSVLFYFDGAEQYARPVRLLWQDHEYELGGVQFWYAEHRGNHLVHHYTLSDADRRYVFELALETENLTWRLIRADVRVEAPEPAPPMPRRSFTNLVGAMG